MLEHGAPGKRTRKIRERPGDLQTGSWERRLVSTLGQSGPDVGITHTEVMFEAGGRVGGDRQGRKKVEREKRNVTEL